jgi:hypothetical protein
MDLGMDIYYMRFPTCAWTWTWAFTTCGFRLAMHTRIYDFFF